MEDPYITRVTLLERASNQNDEKAWDDFVNYYKNFIKMVLNRLLFDKTDSDDLLQVILLKLWVKLQDYSYGKSKFRSWLSIVIRNTVINYLRKKNKNQNILAEEGESILYAYSESDLENFFQKEWEIYASNLALERIKPLFTEKAITIFELTLNNKSVNEISEKLDLNPDSVYKMRARVISRLKSEIKLIRAETEF